MAEAIGELGCVLDKAEALLPAITEVTRLQSEATSQLSNQLGNLEAQINALTDRVKLYALKYLLTQMEEHAARTMQAQTLTMCQAIGARVSLELDREMKQLAQAIHQHQSQVSNSSNWWRLLFGFLSAAATGAVAGALVTWLWAR
ncbi:MAG: hypothetical protein CFE43_09175 [Burkholderiales bacterium PBB3]|nr:MAG: hypothetical protein CFE43_09175 [Burkholderiales bacterium PBB3]